MRTADRRCGMGYISNPIARLVSESRCVQTIDLQHQQLKRVHKREDKAGLATRIETTIAGENNLHLKMILISSVFAVIHEVIEVAKSFNMDVRIIGRTEASDSGNRLSVTHGAEGFQYRP
jgi:hypothetical protein